MRKLLFTGASGFIGRHCLEILSASHNYDIHAVTYGLEKHDYPNVTWYDTDLLDPTSVSSLISTVKPSHLLHLAWYAVPGKFWRSTENFRWTGASLNLLNSFSDRGGKRAVLAGTCAEYDWDYGYCSEAVTPLRPSTLYGTCKHALQQMLSAFSEEKGLCSSWGRIFFLYGPHEHADRLVSSVIGSLLRGKRCDCTPGYQIRDFLHVRDVASAFVSLLESDVPGPVNIGSGNPVSIRDLVSKIAAMLDREDLINFGGRPAPEGEPPLLVADVSRISKEVGWTPKHNLDTGLTETIAWWRKHIHSIDKKNDA